MRIGVRGERPAGDAMSELGSNLCLLLVRELETFERELDLFPHEADIWRTIPGLSNSAANLALHVAGNLQHFVGAVLGRTGYVRNRDLEFARRAGSRDEVKAELRAAVGVVRSVLPQVPEERLLADFPEPVNGLLIRCDRFLMHLGVHAGYHLGQASSVRRAVTADGRSSGPVPLSALVD